MVNAALMGTKDFIIIIIIITGGVQVTPASPDSWSPRLRKSAKATGLRCDKIFHLL
jgi:hypothetical protein